MVKPAPLRTKTLSTKVSEREQTQLEALAEAAGQSLAEWVRETLLAQTSKAGSPGAPPEQVVLAEVLALRAILLNLLFRISNGEAISRDEMQQLIDRADADKVKRAAERLASPPRTEPGI